MTSLEQKLPDDFSRLVLKGSLRVAYDRENPIRMHLFAAGIRELFGHVLHSLAQDEEVRKCVWYEQARDTDTVTRRQRAKYATQGGIQSDFLTEIGVDVDYLHKAAVDAIDGLNKATHVRPGHLETDEKKIDSFICSALGALEGLLDSFRDCRDAIRNALADHVYSAMMDATVSRTFETIDILSGKGYEIDPWIDDPETIVKSIASNELIVRYSGTCHATLFYGSGADGAEISHSFPFWMEFSAPVAKPTELSLIGYFFDDRSWYD